MCKLGLTYNEDHRTCRSCQAAGIRCPSLKGRAKRIKPVRRHTSGPVERDGRKVLVCQTDLRTPNDWNNKLHGRYVYLGERKKWERLFRNVHFFWGKQPEGVRRRLTVVRQVPNRNYLIKDFGNKVFTLKPVEDALVRAGVIIDDAEQYLESVPPIQEIVKDLKETVVEICLEDMEVCHEAVVHPA